MGVYSRFKKDHDGFRKLVELLESTGPTKQKRMIDVGMEEDSEYTLKALEYTLKFEDVGHLNDPELMELTGVAPARVVAYAFRNVEDSEHQRLLRLCPPATRNEVRDCREMEIKNIEINGAQLKLITFLRQLEKRGKVKAKRIPDHL